eukprot:jgi/Botrbrau1/22288/Bobra.0138s0041.1
METTQSTRTISPALSQALNGAHDNFILVPITDIRAYKVYFVSICLMSTSIFLTAILTIYTLFLRIMKFRLRRAYPRERGLLVLVGATLISLLSLVVVWLAIDLQADVLDGRGRKVSLLTFQILGVVVLLAQGFALHGLLVTKIMMARSFYSDNDIIINGRPTELPIFHAP